MSTLGRRIAVPRRFGELARRLPPRAISTESQHLATVQMIDRLMSVARLGKDQRSYLETLVQLVQVYEATRHPVAARGGIDALRHLLDENDMNASDLARTLGVHVSMGTKILRGERRLTVDHVKALAAAFKVRPEIFLD